MRMRCGEQNKRELETGEREKVPTINHHQHDHNMNQLALLDPALIAEAREFAAKIKMRGFTALGGMFGPPDVRIGRGWTVVGRVLGEMKPRPEMYPDPAVCQDEGVDAAAKRRGCAVYVAKEMAISFSVVDVSSLVAVAVASADSIYDLQKLWDENLVVLYVWDRYEELIGAYLRGDFGEADALVVGGREFENGRETFGWAREYVVAVSGTTRDRYGEADWCVDEQEDWVARAEFTPQWVHMLAELFLPMSIRDQYKPEPAEEEIVSEETLRIILGPPSQR